MIATYYMCFNKVYYAVVLDNYCCLPYTATYILYEDSGVCVQEHFEDIPIHYYKHRRLQETALERNLLVWWLKRVAIVNSRFETARVPLVRTEKLEMDKMAEDEKNRVQGKENRAAGSRSEEAGDDAVPVSQELRESDRERTEGRTKLPADNGEPAAESSSEEPRDREASKDEEE